MNFDSRFWYKRAIEMRSIASETKNPQSKETMLGIAHDYDLLGHQFEYREKCALRDVIHNKMASARSCLCALTLGGNALMKLKALVSA